MEFFKCSIAGVSYGTGVTEVQKAVLERAGKELSFDEIEFSSPLFEKGFNLRDHRLENLRRSASSILIRCYQSDGGYDHHKYEVLNTIDFSSMRKRMSVIVRDPAGQLLLLCKGADNVIFERLSSEVEEWRYITLEHMKDYGEAGLRTLAVAYSRLDEESYSEWQARAYGCNFLLSFGMFFHVEFKSRWIRAKQDIINSDEQSQALEELAEEIETNLILVGATAIEDKLQVGVPRAIHNLATAGIKIWVLTGDKMETAINIGYACRLLQHNTRKHIIRLEDSTILQGDALKGKKITEE
ncbi:hypothetical protein KI387_020415, partial [Taxus chinensis]